MIERHWNADLLAYIFGFIFIAVGIAGFFPNPIVWSTGVFQVNEAHNLIHIVTGILFLAGAYFGASVWTIRAIAVLYTIVAIIGFVIPDNMLFGLVAMNAPDRWLHAALAAVLLLVGFVTPAHEPLRQAHM
jgi:phage shock protein PspC (stress-responsive transcriptional regulator)